MNKINKVIFKKTIVIIAVTTLTGMTITSGAFAASLNPDRYNSTYDVELLQQTQSTIKIQQQLRQGLQKLNHKIKSYYKANK